MTKILKTVLAERNDIKKATSSHIDDIVIDISQVPTSEVASYLENNGLKAKQPETLLYGAGVETVLAVIQYVVLVKVLHNFRYNDMLRHFATSRSRTQHFFLYYKPC